ncbi:hypothetical protein GCM10010279_36300 [Streptomyces mutabilis]|nr:hypothetical protein GCM10010279_36300 [Streptomyces mutabilis]
MLPGTCASLRAVPWAVGETTREAGGRAAEVVAADAGGVSGRARAAAHVTPIEEARNPRIRDRGHPVTQVSICELTSRRTFSSDPVAARYAVRPVPARGPA